MISAAIAKEQAALGRKVLLVEIGDKSYFKDFWSLPSIGHEPVPAPGGFDVAIWNGESSLHEYVVHLLKMERLYRLFFQNKVMRALIDVAPGLNEIAILGKITSGIRKVGPPLEYDLIVVDSYATGHALALLHAPKGMTDAINFGPMGTHSRQIAEVLADPKLSAYVAVTLLEELPIVETLEFRTRLRTELGVETSIVANKALRPEVSREDLRVVEASGEPIAEFAKYAEAILERQDHFRMTLSETVGEFFEVPLMLTAEPRALVEGIGEALRPI